MAKAQKKLASRPSQRVSNELWARAKKRSKTFTEVQVRAFRGGEYQPGESRTLVVRGDEAEFVTQFLRYGLRDKLVVPADEERKQ